MKKNTQRQSGKSFRVLVLFLGIVFMVLFLAFVVKFVAVFSKSTFDFKHRYTVVILSKPLQLISFAPDTKTISVLEIPSSEKNESGYIMNRIHMPIDGDIVEKDQAIDTQSIDIKDQIEGYIQHVLLTYPTTKTSLTILDVIRLWFFTKSIEIHNVFTATLPKSLEAVEPAVVDKTATSFFSDDSLTKENQHIQIINATGAPGVGNSFAQILTNIGGNVISVTTAHGDSEHTTITYTGEKTYTVEKLEQLLRIKATFVKKQTVYTIIVTLGKDKEGFLTQ